jgi:hypothetical protein
MVGVANATGKLISMFVFRATGNARGLFGLVWRGIVISWILPAFAGVY